MYVSLEDWVPIKLGTHEAVAESWGVLRWRLAWSASASRRAPELPACLPLAAQTATPNLPTKIIPTKIR